MCAICNFFFCVICCYSHVVVCRRLSKEAPKSMLSDSSITVSSKSFMRANSGSDFGKVSLQQVRKMDRLDSLRGSTTETFTEETFGPLSNVRFAVFALGSSAYPNFCQFGKYVDNVLGELGGERLTKVAYGDEMCGQEHAFRKWAPEVFKVCKLDQNIEFELYSFHGCEYVILFANKSIISVALFALVKTNKLIFNVCNRWLVKHFAWIQTKHFQVRFCTVTL